MIFAIKPFEIHDGEGIRTTVFLKGCPLRCKWCHNPESFSFGKEILFDDSLCKNCGQCVEICHANIQTNGQHLFLRENCNLCGRCQAICPSRAFEIVGTEDGAKEVADRVLKDKLFFQGSGGGVTFSGGEPLAQVDFCVELAKILKEQDINVAVDTSGFVARETIDKILPYVDTFLFDVKAIDRDVHIACTGVSNEQILENIRYVDSLGIPMEIRYPYVPTMNDGEWENIARFVKDLHHVKVLRILPYHNYAERKYFCMGMQDMFLEFPLPTIAEIDEVVKKIKLLGVEQVGRY